LIFREYLKDALFKRFYMFGFAGIGLLCLGYGLRFMLENAQGPVRLFLDTFPNLFGSFGTPFLLLLILSARRKDISLIKSLPAFLLLNLFTFAVVLLIEWGHVLLSLGIWDNNDILASAIGGLAAVVFWFIGFKRVDQQSVP